MGVFYFYLCCQYRVPIAQEVIVIQTMFFYSTVLYLSNAANFEITPDPLTVAVEQGTATFYCQHSSSDAINWRVNVTSVNKINSPNIATTTFTGVNTITFQTILEFNQTTVECVAIFFDGSPPQFTSPVALLIQGSLSACTYVKLMCY